MSEDNSKIFTLSSMLGKKNRPTTNSSQVQSSKSVDTKLTTSGQNEFLKKVDPKKVPNVRPKTASQPSETNFIFPKKETNTTNLLVKPINVQENVNNFRHQKIVHISASALIPKPRNFSGISANEPEESLHNDILKSEKYSKKNFILPVDVKYKEDESEKHNLQIESDLDKNISNDLHNQFCFIQLPTNLPCEGLYKESSRRDEIDFQFDSEDIFKIINEKRFDSTGFYLERDFKTPLVKETIIKEEKGKGLEKDINFETYKIGKLCRMKDGKLKLKIGENYFDLTSGMQDNFYKEIVSINLQKKAVCNLFPIEKKIIVKPDLNSV